MGLRSVTVLPKALLEVSPDPLWGDDDDNNKTKQNNNNPANINSPLSTSPPGWFVNPFGHPLTLIKPKDHIFTREPETTPQKQISTRAFHHDSKLPTGTLWD